MFDYLAMSYKVSDYTFMITLMCWPKPIILVLKLTLLLELWVLLSSHWLALFKHSLWVSLAIQLSREAHEDSDYTTINAIVYWRLGAELTPVAKLWVL